MVALEPQAVWLSLSLFKDKSLRYNMLVRLCGPRFLLHLLGCIWLIAILDIEVVVGFSLSPHGIKVSLRKGQHQSKPKSNEQYKTNLYSAGSAHNTDPSVKEMTKDIVSLESVRRSLIRQEETLIFALIRRATFRYNECSYKDKNFMLVPDPQVHLPLPC